MNTERNKSELKSVLANRGLSAEFADIINISDDIEASQANIDKLDKLFKAAVKAEVEKRIAGNAPRGNSGATANITKEGFRKMGLAQQAQLAKDNPELYKQLLQKLSSTADVGAKVTDTGQFILNALLQGWFITILSHRWCELYKTGFCSFLFRKQNSTTL